MIAIALVSLVVISVASASPLEAPEVQFEAFKSQHGRAYATSAEEINRYEIFKQNLQLIEAHNALYEQGLVTYKKGVNSFTDLSEKEFQSFLGTLTKPIINETDYIDNGIEAPASIDWRTKGQVTGVKNQGSCGSCWAFSITGSTEAAYYRKSKKLVSLSEQQLVDCTTNINKGCSGGYLDHTFPYIVQHGLESESSYPYTARRSTCKYSASKIVTKITKYVSLRSESSILNAVGSIGPVSVTMDATHLSSYSSGIFSDSKCSASKINHAVLIVGYGTDNGKAYWIVKNSWGTSWGEKGYFKLLRGKNMCAIGQDAVYPIIN